ncbi:AAA family ATPase [Methanobacterium alcaliphilum]|uniref:nucleotide-binding protein n=1 Tax=Methanobacterium alcaliphilum TaxID=392018 RepID=UPI00200B7EFF|nr:nitrogenase iron protein NifH [Methanobacterium alcaliphilum]MCK9150674.1 nitrogenase iron protein NifH [Methanobacterium alcaliphilum]
MSKRKQIAIYGKGGIGKSTTTSNLSAALSDIGYKVMQVGCDPKNDSTNTLRHGKSIPTVMDTIRSGSNDFSSVIHEGYNDILCVEAGGPEPGVGCAGRGIIAAIELLDNNGVIDEYDPDIVIYDVLGDVVCGGFAIPIRQGLAEQIYTVTSSDYMAIYAVNNLFKGILKYSGSGGGLLGGIIGNSISKIAQREMIQDFSQQTETEVIEYVPRSPIVTRCELDGKTTIEGAPESEQAEVYRELARKVINNKQKFIPRPFDVDDLSDWGSTWVNKLLLEQKTAIEGIQDGGTGV